MVRSASARRGASVSFQWWCDDCDDFLKILFAVDSPEKKEGARSSTNSPESLRESPGDCHWALFVVLVLVVVYACGLETSLEDCDATVTRCAQVLRLYGSTSGFSNTLTRRNRRTLTPTTTRPHITSIYRISVCSLQFAQKITLQFFY